jgi:hypothetical protein
MFDGRRIVQTSDKSTIAIPRVATFHTSERKRNTPAAYKAPDLNHFRVGSFCGD